MPCSLRRATPAEVAAYAAQSPAPLYPLSHWVRVGTAICAVERLGTSHPDDPRYEIMAPAGCHFDDDSLHSLLCYDLSDVRDRADGNSVTVCNANCR